MTAGQNSSRKQYEQEMKFWTDLGFGEPPKKSKRKQDGKATNKENQDSCKVQNSWRKDYQFYSKENQV